MEGMLDMSLRDRVRAILLGKLGTDGAEAAPLGDVVADARKRQEIAEAIRMEFPYLRPPWHDGDLSSASTLDSIAREIGRRRTLASSPRQRR
ncbi:MAG TPA: hypothetical protein VF092_29365 [Longimicrobium sp.]